MIDLRHEKLLTLAEAARHPSLPARRRGKRVHVSSLYRYAKTGIRGVKLEVVRFAGNLCTSEKALQRFCEALTQIDSNRSSITNLTKSRSPQDIAEDLSSLGI